MTIALRMLLPPLLIIAIALGIHVGVGTYDNGYWINQLTLIGIAIMLAVSLNIVNGFTGQFSLGHAGFLSIGAFFGGSMLYYAGEKNLPHWFAQKPIAGVLSYTQPFERLADGTAWITHGDLFFLGVCIGAGIVAAIAGLIVGLPSLRLRGDYLAIVTVGFGEIVRILIQSSNRQVTRRFEKTDTWDVVSGLGSAMGFNQIPKFASLFWIYLFAGATVLVALRLKYSTHGRAYLSIREDEIAAEAMGIKLTRYKVQAFVISAFFAGIAGALYASSQGTVNAGEMAFMRSIEIVVIVVLGGMGSVSGVVIAAIVLTYLPELLKSPNVSETFQSGVEFAAGSLGKWMGGKLLWLYQNAGSFSTWRLIIYAMILILVMILRPRGLLGTRELWDLFRRRKRVTT